MPWCPKCKNEYVEGIKVCTDCGVDLVEALDEMQSRPVTFGEQEEMERLKEFLIYSKIKSAEVIYDETDGVYELYVNEEEKKDADKAVKIFLHEEEKKKAEESVPEIESDIPQRPAIPAYKGVYQNSAEKAKENRSSGYMLVIIGGLGLAVIVLLAAGIIKFPVMIANKYMVFGVMGGLFLLFLIMGVVSLKSSKVFARKAETENNLTSEIKKWCEGNLSAGMIDEDLFSEGESGEEIKYFKRIDKMKQMISHQFMNLDEDFLDAFVDDYYPTIFE